MTAALAAEAAGCIDVAADRLLELGRPLEKLLVQLETNPYRLTLFLEGQPACRVTVGAFGIEEEWLIAIGDRRRIATAQVAVPSFVAGWYESSPRVGVVSTVQPPYMTLSSTFR